MSTTPNTPARVPAHFASLMNIKPSILGTIGRTPLVKLNRLAAGIDATIAVKGGSSIRSAA